MPSTYHITEPHPSVRSHYMHAGRGGAGNVTHVDPTSLTAGPTATGPASRTSLPAKRPSNVYMMAGRGGAGNAVREKERAIFSFDEELERNRRMMEHQAPVYHIGRGGAGNYMDERTPTKRTNSHSSVDSVDSDHSGRARRSIEGVFGRVRSSFTK